MNFLRFVLVVSYDLTLYNAVFGVFMPLCILFYMVALAILQPYKSDIHLKLDLTLFLGLSLWSTALLIGSMDEKLNLTLVLIWQYFHSAL